MATRWNVLHRCDCGEAWSETWSSGKPIPETVCGGCGRGVEGRWTEGGGTRRFTLNITSKITKVTTLEAVS